MRVVIAVAALLLVLAGGVAFSGDLASTALGSFLALGFAIGLAHALDADHLAAVAAMMGKGDGPRAMIVRGVSWGVGHTVALFVICTAVLSLGLTISGRVEAALEMAVGVMIVLLGLRVIWKLHRERVHIHAHEHDGTRHIHAHSHKGDDADRHHSAPHQHAHPRAGAVLPVLGVGLLHGAAGSAGLLVLAVASAETVGQAMLVFAVFGLGSLLGMAALTAIASYPLGYIHRGSAWMRTALALAIGGLAFWVGSSVVMDSLAGLRLAGG